MLVEMRLYKKMGQQSLPAQVEEDARDDDEV